jgi:hypothetical protein
MSGLAYFTGVTLFSVLFLVALTGSSCFALGRALGRGERYERGYREGFRDGETGSLARAARLVQARERAAIAPAVESMLMPYAVPQQKPGRAVGPAVVGIAQVVN